MVSDVPVIDYNYKKKGLGNSKADVEEMDALADKWAERHNNMSGESVSLSDFMKKKI